MRGRLSQAKDFVQGVIGKHLATQRPIRDYGCLLVIRGNIEKFSTDEEGGEVRNV